jgi:hypothetical protein
MREQIQPEKCGLGMDLTTTGNPSRLLQQVHELDQKIGGLRHIGAEYQGGSRIATGDWVVQGLTRRRLQLSAEFSRHPW